MIVRHDDRSVTCTPEEEAATRAEIAPLLKLSEPLEAEFKLTLDAWDHDCDALREEAEEAINNLSGISVYEWDIDKPDEPDAPSELVDLRYKIYMLERNLPCGPPTPIDQLIAESLEVIKDCLNKPDPTFLLGVGSSREGTA